MKKQLDTLQRGKFPVNPCLKTTLPPFITAKTNCPWTRTWMYIINLNQFSSELWINRAQFIFWLITQRFPLFQDTEYVGLSMSYISQTIYCDDYNSKYEQDVCSSRSNLLSFRSGIVCNFWFMLRFFFAVNDFFVTFKKISMLSL